MKYLVDFERWNEDEECGVAIVQPLEIEDQDTHLYSMKCKIIYDSGDVIPEEEIDLIWEKKSPDWCATIQEAQARCLHVLFVEERE